MTEFKYKTRNINKPETKILLKRKHVHMTHTFVQVHMYIHSKIPTNINAKIINIICKLVGKIIY